ncbi:B3/B4 domain-containing protein [Nocardiopsis suaedae]|uniref:Phenylalanine--tRNA ligase beta subunit-related protein n=1 Tax=Nocardiopsis suaedae TaxID=3018444 RepID=A0ABT4TQ00_9ACTN|nr:phenylalanine--tRNA ligase beta subunit-related protein [Nocardiopsis suaedae]MDA2806752.1 phenylalanine--tRNA ligase beta subunit-related protein [Nocardiopsis suaedae]
MRFEHSDRVWEEFPSLAAGVVRARGVGGPAPVDEAVSAFEKRARARRAAEGELEPIRAWRRAYAAMGFKPTKHRCAAESLLRRWRREGALPRVHPLVDLCNAASLAYAVPVAVVDVAGVGGDLQVRHARGTEEFTDLSGRVERVEPGEVVYAQGAGVAHSRRWAGRQSAASGVGPGTGEVLVVAEGLHEGAAGDVGELAAELAECLGALWGAHTSTAVLEGSARVFEF